MLRDELIEAVADSYIDTHNQGLALVDDYAEAALDAILDTLEANAEEWDRETSDRYMTAEAYRADTDGKAAILNLLAALRPPVSSSRDGEET